MTETYGTPPGWRPENPTLKAAKMVAVLFGAVAAATLAFGVMASGALAFIGLPFAWLWGVRADAQAGLLWVTLVDILWMPIGIIRGLAYIFGAI